MFDTTITFAHRNSRITFGSGIQGWKKHTFQNFRTYLSKKNNNYLICFQFFSFLLSSCNLIMQIKVYEKEEENAQN